MLKIMQTKFGVGGNCQSATIATLLGIQIDEVPDFWENCDLTEGCDDFENGRIYNENFNRFIKNFGLTSISLGVAAGDHSEWINSVSRQLAGIPLLVNGLSPRGFMHSVIWMDGELYHDPHPEGGGVIPANVTFLMPTFGDDPIHPLVKQAFVEGFTMGQEMEKDDEKQCVWRSAEEAWVNSDSLDGYVSMVQKLDKNPNK